MNKLVTYFICTATYLVSQTVAYAHGAHGAETSISHQFTQPQHLIELLVTTTVIALFIVLRKIRQMTKKSQ